LFKQSAAGVLGATLLGAMVLGACPRPVLPELGGGSTDSTPEPVVALLPLGQPCVRPAQCESEVCGDGVCCEEACSTGFACNLQRSPGVCALRLPGDACTAATDCATGFCEQDVCCATACDGTCRSCSHGAQPGTCGLVADNQDPHNDCGSACAACFGGLCLPAHPGTDPGGDCADNPLGSVCTTQGRCGRAEGDPCSSDGECALGRCIGGGCVVTSASALDDSHLDPRATSRRVLGVVRDAEGAVVVLLREQVPSSDPGLPNLRDYRFVLWRTDGTRTWTAEVQRYIACYGFTPGDLNNENSPDPPGEALLAMGTRVLVIAHGFSRDPVSFNCSGASVPQDLRAHWFTPELRLLRSEPVVKAEEVPAASTIWTLAAAFDGANTVAVAAGWATSQPTSGSGYSLMLVTHSLKGGGWSHAPVEEDAPGRPAVAFDGLGRVVLVTPQQLEPVSGWGARLAAYRSVGENHASVERLAVTATPLCSHLGGSLAPRANGGFLVSADCLGHLDGQPPNRPVFTVLLPDAPENDRLPPVRPAAGADSNGNRAVTLPSGTTASVVVDGESREVLLVPVGEDGNAGTPVLVATYPQVGLTRGVVSSNQYGFPVVAFGVDVVDPNDPSQTFIGTTVHVVTLSQ
jgi:hypothetical protein